jgi:membrane associated rhomboid family serine protease
VISEKTQQQGKLVFVIFVIFSLVEVINLLTGYGLNQFGNYPREFHALPGILISPFLHGSLSHFFSNIITLCLFSFLMLQYGNKRFWQVTLWIIIISGLLVWLFARSAMHVGVSGLIYGYFAYLLLAGFLNGKIKLLLISLLVGFFYGGLIWGVMPQQSFVSWESHLFGFLAGLAAAKFWPKTH